MTDSMFRQEVVDARGSQWLGGISLVQPARLWVLTAAAAAAAGDTVTTWLTLLHMAAVGGLPMKIAIALLGLALAVLSCTGVLIWARKKSARKKSA